jgi:hypothetical protein
VRARPPLLATGLQPRKAFMGDKMCIDYSRRRCLPAGSGVIYRPRTERQSHYFYAELSRQFDAVIHIDETQGGGRAVHSCITKAFR